MRLGEGELKDKLNLSLVTEIENKGKETGLGAKMGNAVFNKFTWTAYESSRWIKLMDN